MATKDIRSQLLPKLALLGAISTNTTTAGGIIDTADYDCGVMLSVFSTVYTDGTYNFTVEHGDIANLSDATALAAINFNGTLAGLAITAVSAEGANLGSIGIVGNKRYIRINAVSTAVTTGATIAATIHMKAENQPAIGLSA